MTEQRLPGGRSFGAVRAGDEVRRPVPHPDLDRGHHGGDRDDDGLLGWGALPDLVIVDGGRGQLTQASAV